MSVKYGQRLVIEAGSVDRHNSEIVKAVAAKIVELVRVHGGSPMAIQTVTEIEDLAVLMLNQRIAESEDQLVEIRRSAHPVWVALVALWHWREFQALRELKTIVSRLAMVLMTIVLLVGCTAAPVSPQGDGRTPASTELSFGEKWDGGVRRVQQCMFGGLMAVFAIPAQGLDGFARPLCEDHPEFDPK